MATRNIVPRATGEGQIGTSAKTWNAGYFNDIAVTNGVTASTFTGDLTGDVTGDVTGNLTGDVTGDVTGNLTGDVTGDLTGNVTGDVTGNVTGDVTGTASGNLALSGGTMTGAISFDATGEIGYRATTHESTPRPCKQLMLSSTDINHWADEGGAKMALHTYDSTGTNTAENGSFGLVATDGTNSADLVGYPSGNLTWKGLSLTDGDFLTVRHVSVTTNSGTLDYSISAPAVSGYQFLCWVMSATNGYVNYSYIASAWNANATVWMGSPDNGSVDCTALYIRKW